MSFEHIADKRESIMPVFLLTYPEVITFLVLFSEINICIHVNTYDINLISQ